MKNKLALLIEILPWLSLNPGVSAAEAARQFSITESQLIDLLQLAVFTGPGQFGGELVDIDFEDSESLFVSDAKGLSRPVKFDNVQSLQIISGLYYLLQIPGLVDNDSLSQLLNKFMRATGILNPPVEFLPTNSVDKTAEFLAKAIKTNTSVEIEYSSITSGKVSTRLIDPKSFTIEEANQYVKAWCHAALAYRIFRLDRILGVKNTERLQVPSESKLSGQTSEILVQLVVTKRILIQLDQRLVTSQKELSDRNFEITLKVHDLNWIAREILVSGGQIKALGPKELTALIDQKITKWQELNPIG